MKSPLHEAREFEIHGNVDVVNEQQSLFKLN